jgi:GT2 family glycosyltransferase
MSAPAAIPSLTLCICTVDRVDILRRCLESVIKGSIQPDAVLVSDDSADGSKVAMVCRDFEGVTYIQGPRRGLCANRNWVIRHATTTHVSLLDDDAMVSESFIKDAKALISECADNVIITGIVDEPHAPVISFNPSFLGHFTKPPKDRFENVNLNCNVFPRHAFDHANFDEAIAYGYEDMDLCSHLLFLGFRIQFESRLQNLHRPPNHTAPVKKVRFLRTERARFYTSVKRYMLWKRNYFALFAYLILAPIHRAAHAIKGGFWFDLKYCIPDMMAAFQGALRERAKLQQFAVDSSNAPLRSRS